MVRDEKFWCEYVQAKYVHVLPIVATNLKLMMWRFSQAQILPRYLEVDIWKIVMKEIQ